MRKEKQHYGLLTAITMIVGIVIGSGIFFKADDILSFTGGNVALGVLVLCIGAFSIIFGSVSLTEFSIRTTKSGGLVAYFEDFVSPVVASGFGWFQTFLYYPAINVIVSWAAGIYTCLLFQLPNTLEMQVMIGSGYLLLIFLMNIFSYRLAGTFQNITTIIKLIPLLGVALLGFFWTKGTPDIPSTVTAVHSTNVGWGWLAALAPVAFSYDGWPIATSITPEVKNARRNMTIALTVGPLIVLSVYVLYFLGMNKILGPEYILSMGDQAIYEIGNLVFGHYGGNLILLFVIISVLGVTNGVTLGSLRMPQSLATKNMIPNAEKVSLIDEKLQLSKASCWISLLVTFFWMFVHYLTQKSGILGHGDISEIAIVFGYICYAALYIRVIQLFLKKEIKGVFKGLIAPLFGILGSTIIMVGGIVSNPVYMPIFIFICLLLAIVGSYYYQKRQKTMPATWRE